MSEFKNKKQFEKWQLLVLLLKEIAENKGITQMQIAEKTGYKQSHVSRFFSLKYNPTLDTFLKIAKAIGVSFLFEDEEKKTNFNPIRSDLKDMVKSAITFIIGIGVFVLLSKI